MLSVNAKGSIGLIKVIDDLYSRGYSCFTPFDDYSPVDLISLASCGKTTKFQVKYRSLNSRNRYEISARSVVNGKSVPIDRSLIDGWAVYLADLDRVIYIPTSAMVGKGVLNINPADVGKFGSVP